MKRNQFDFTSFGETVCWSGAPVAPGESREIDSPRESAERLDGRRAHFPLSRWVGDRYKAATMPSDDALWYDEFYRLEQTKFAPWYRCAIPHLRRELLPGTKLVELACGQGQLLRFLARENLVAADRLYGLEQSKTAVGFVKKWLPDAQVEVGNIYQLQYPRDFFDVCFLMETIEHLENPTLAVKNIFSILAPGGVLYVSFPNFLSPFWLPFRWLCDFLKKPQWIVRQPIDLIYFVPQVKRLFTAGGFKFEKGIGCGYGPPLLYRWERDWMTHGLNRLGLWWFSFHPILVFRKP
jgi:2-polyprenyl-3-methyl-5-hydroxy-6-metoxy-1,4-benzoquinol methylase